MFLRTKRRLRISIAAGILIMTVVLCTAIYTLFSGVLINDSSERFSDVSVQMAYDMETRAEFIEQTVSSFIKKNDIGNIAERANSRIQINDSIHEMLSYSLYINDVYLFLANGEIYGSNSMYARNLFKYMDENGLLDEKSGWTAVKNPPMSEAPISRSGQLFLYSTVIYNRNGLRIGCLAADASDKFIGDVFSANLSFRKYGGEAYFADGNGKIYTIYAPEGICSKKTLCSFAASEKKSMRMRRGELILVKTRAARPSLTLVTAADFKEEKQKLRMLGYFLITVCALSAFIIYRTSGIIVNTVITPLENLYEKMTCGEFETAEADSDENNDCR